MSAFELVIDNAKMLINCHEEAPIEAFTLDLPAWYCNQTGGAAFSDPARFTKLDDSGDYGIVDGGRLGVGYFAESDHGAIVSGTWIYMPETPDGYELSRASYVVRAYRPTDGGTYTGTPFSGYTPGTGMTNPYLNAESSGTSNNYVIDLPLAAFAESEWSGNEVLSRLTNPPGSQLPCTRLWNEAAMGGGSMTVHVSYYAIRLYYTPL